MRRALGFLGSRVLGTRYGIALLLAVVILAIVGLAQLFAGGGQRGIGLRDDAGATSTVAPTAGEDGVVSPPAAVQPVTSPGARPPEGVATAFATAWVSHRGKDSTAWVGGLRPHATRSLVDKLVGVDPAGVPADRITGAAQVIPHGESFVEVAIPVDSGSLRLRLIADGGRWLVDGVDWARG